MRRLNPLRRKQHPPEEQPAVAGVRRYGVQQEKTTTQGANGQEWYWLPLMQATAILIFLGILLHFGRQIWLELNQPVSRIEISGETRHLDKARLGQQLLEQLNQPLLSLNLVEVVQRVQSEPWVNKVAVARSWPAALDLQVKEEVPVARWGDEGLLNHKGEIFWPSLKPEYQSLPRLNGPQADTARVMAQYHDLSRVLQTAGLTLTGLELEARGAWALELDNGIRVITGRHRVQDRLQRFVRIYRKSLADKAGQIEQIDIRYTNGVAVKWKAGTQQQNAG